MKKVRKNVDQTTCSQLFCLFWQTVGCRLLGFLFFYIFISTDVSGRAPCSSFSQVGGRSPQALLLRASPSRLPSLCIPPPPCGCLMDSFRDSLWSFLMQININ